MFYHSNQKKRKHRGGSCLGVGFVCLTPLKRHPLNRSLPPHRLEGRGVGTQFTVQGHIKIQQNHPLHFFRFYLYAYGCCDGWNMLSLWSGTNWRRGLVGIGVAPHVFNHWAIYSVPTNTQPLLLQPSFQQINHQSEFIMSYRCYMYIYTQLICHTQI